MRAVLACILLALAIELMAPVARIGRPLRGDCIWRPPARVSVYRVKALVSERAQPAAHALQQAVVGALRPRVPRASQRVSRPEIPLSLPLPVVVPLRANRPPPVV